MQYHTAVDAFFGQVARRCEHGTIEIPVFFEFQHLHATFARHFRNILIPADQ